MGTWNTGPFDNDPAADAVAALANGTFSMDQFRFECGLGPLSTDAAESILALAALLKGHRPEQYADDDLDYPFTMDDKRWIRRRAQAAVRPGESELYSMWEATGELDEWLEATRRYVS